MDIKLICVPTMHEALSPAALPEDVLFIDPGLGGAAAASRLYTPSNLPFSGKEARGILDEMLGLGRALASGGELKNLAGAELLARQLEQSGKATRDELLALRQFVQNGHTREQRDQACGLSHADQLKAAQKVLLLGWELERNSLDIMKTEELVERGRNALRQSLGEGMSDPDELSGEADEAAPITPGAGERHGSMPLVNWRAMLEAAAPFLPEDAILVSSHAELRAELIGLGMLGPLPEDAAEILSGWDEALLSNLLWVNLPLWRILGLRRPPEDRPALSLIYEMVVFRA